MLRGQYCWDCQKETGRKVQAHKYIGTRFWRYPVCKMHKKLSTNAYLRIQRAMKLQENRVLRAIKRENAEGHGYLWRLLASHASYNAEKRLLKKGQIVFVKTYAWTHGRGFWVKTMVPKKYRTYIDWDYK